MTVSQWKGIVLPILGLLASIASGWGQVQVHLQFGRDQYVAHEAVEVTLTITNRAGRDLSLHGGGSGNWLDFVITSQRGTPLSPLNPAASFQAATVPAGRSVSQKINLSRLFNLTGYGRYSCYAVIRLPGDGQNVFTSNRESFNVTKARTIYSQRIGVGGASNAREYRLMTFAVGRKTHLYIQVEDVRTARMLQTYSVGEALTFRQPQATVDGSNNLHILYLVSPTVFVHGIINPDGRFVSSDQFKRGATGSPELLTFANGEVRVGGGVPYDPQAAAEQRAKVRRLSERPPFVFQ
jgi:hypothetical protein